MALILSFFLIYLFTAPQTDICAEDGHELRSVDVKVFPIVTMIRLKLSHTKTSDFIIPYNIHSQVLFKNLIAA